MMKAVIAAALAGVTASAAASTKCDDLSRRSYSARWGIDTQVSDVVRDVLRGTGWSLDLRVSGREPSIRGNLSGASSRVLDSVVAKLSASGTQINFRYYPEECRVLLAIHNPSPAPVQSRGRVDTAGGDGAAPSAAAQTPAEAATGRWVLRAGRPINKELAEWAMQAGWTLAWKPERTWLVPADAAFDGEFEDAIAAVIESLFDQGKPVRLILWKGNQFAEVIDVNAQAR